MSQKDTRNSMLQGLSTTYTSVLSLFTFLLKYPGYVTYRDRQGSYYD